MDLLLLSRSERNLGSDSHPGEAVLVADPDSAPMWRSWLEEAFEQPVELAEIGGLERAAADAVEPVAPSRGHRDGAPRDAAAAAARSVRSAGRIAGVDPNGCLRIQTEDGASRAFNLKEIQLII